MHVVVLGAGVVGVTTAYYLSERGYRVTVIDRAGHVASGASEGNGGQLSYSFTDAMASPALLSKLPGILAGRDPAFHVAASLDSRLIRWGLSFLGQCTNRQARHNTLAVLDMALRSKLHMQALLERVPLEFSFCKAGKLVMIGHRDHMVAANEMCAIKRDRGCQVRTISMDEAIEIEPALKHMENGYAGAIYSADDEAGDALEFTEKLAQWLVSNREVSFNFNTCVQRIVIDGKQMTSVETDQATFRPDAVVVCMGARSSQILKTAGVKANIYPVRGYSLTLPPGEQSNLVSLSDLKNKIVFSRLGGRIRIAGFADFVGFRTSGDNARAEQLLQVARQIAPDIADYGALSKHQWGGFRPMTPDSRPIVGATAVDRLYVNSGHGMLGWTLACVSGHEAAAAIQ